MVMQYAIDGIEDMLVIELKVASIAIRAKRYPRNTTVRQAALGKTDSIVSKKIS